VFSSRQAIRWLYKERNHTAGVVRTQDVFNDEEKLLRFKVREMATMQWKLVSPCVFSVKCKNIVFTDNTCTECNKPKFRAALYRSPKKRSAVGDGTKNTTNLKFIPKSHLT
jgi:hypothetical protein